MASPALSETLLKILVCPVCHYCVTAGPLNAPLQWLHCTGCGRYYPVQDGIPVMLQDRATVKPPQT